MSNSDEEDNAAENVQNGELERIAETFAKVKDFLEAGEFSFGPIPPNQAATPVRRSALSVWKNYYKSLVMKPGHTMQKLYPALDQCEAVETKVLKMEKSHLVRQLHGLKQQYDSEFQSLIDSLSTVTYDVLLRGFGGTLNQHQERRLNTYFMELQVEVSVKIGKLQEIDAGIGSRYAKIISRVKFADLPIPAARPAQVAA